MKKNSLLSLLGIFLCTMLQAQRTLTPELMWTLGRVSFVELTPDKTQVVYAVSKTEIAENKNKTSYFIKPLAGGQAKEYSYINSQKLPKINGAEHIKLSPDGKKAVYNKQVLITPMLGTDLYPQWSKANVYVYNDLNQRHWDSWEDGYYSHVFVADVVGDVVINEKDIMAGEPHDCPSNPHGSADEFQFSPDGQHILYVTKKKSGKAYALSTNTDLYLYSISNGTTSNLTQGMMGYDTHPVYNPDGTTLAWLSMARDGFESDKNDIIIMDRVSGTKLNLTKNWDETVGSFVWSNDGRKIYFVAPTHGTEQLFEINIQDIVNGATPHIKQLTEGAFDITGICAETDQQLLLTRTDINHATELYTYSLGDAKLQQFTFVNEAFYQSLDMPTVEPRYTTLDDGEKVFSWVIYPPRFDPSKKYPLLLYCQGGPQGALSQFYSFRWNFQLMASQGYIVIAPNRTGMPGWGAAWNEAISKDWGGAPMRDYIAVVDDISEEPYIDPQRRGAVGASYGGYSVFMLAGIHEGRFKSFISHCGLFDLKSWYGTTEELFFANWDIGGPYWEKDNKAAQRSYRDFSPSKYIDQWNTPIMIIQGGKDYRVPIEQGMQAFQVAQLKGIKSRMLYFPEENHWVLKPQNALIWQNEFFKWLKETL